MTCPMLSTDSVEYSFVSLLDEEPSRSRPLHSFRLPPGPSPDSDEADFVLNEKQIYKSMVEKYVPKYGNVITMYKEKKPVILINDIDHAYEAFVSKYSKTTSGRHATYGEKILSGNRNNILNSDYGSMWIVLQKYLHKGLRHCAQLDRLDEIMNKCFDKLRDNIEFKKGSKEGGIKMDDDLFWMADNIITMLLFNEMLGEEEYQTYHTSMNVMPYYNGKCDFEEGKPSNDADVKAVGDLEKVFNELCGILQKRIDSHSLKQDYKIACYDITDFLLLGVEEYYLDPRAKKLGVVLKDLNVKHILVDVIFASQEGLGNSFIWILGLLALHPDIQGNIRTEISMFRDDNKTPVTLQWKAKMPYTNAVLCEMQRFASADPFTDFHVAMDDIKLRDFDIPKDSLIILNLYAIHHEPSRWADPEKILPQRFLSEDGHKFQRRKDFVPYGLGLRTCVGNTFSENVLFMLIMLFVDNYKLVWGENSDNEIIDDSEAVFIRDVVPFNIQFIKMN